MKTSCYNKDMMMIVYFVNIPSTIYSFLVPRSVVGKILHYYFKIEYNNVLKLIIITCCIIVIILYYLN